MGVLKHEFFEEKVLAEMRESISKRVGDIKRDVGPSITE